MSTTTSKPKRFRTPSYNKFEKDFEPVEHETTATGNPLLLETYGEELEKVRAQVEANPNLVLTVVEDDNGKLRIVAGFHYVNRMNYIFTKKPWLTGEEVFCYL